MSHHEEGLIASDLALAEVSSAISRKHRERPLTREEAVLAWEALDLWAVSANRVSIAPEDIAHAQHVIRLLGPPMRTPDAIHVSLTHRLRATLVTFDRQLAAAARPLNLPLTDA